MEKFIFAWGQRQSAMWMQIHFDMVGPKATLFNKGMSSILSIKEGAEFSQYISEKAFAEWRANSIKYLEKKFTEELFKEINTFIREYNIWVEEIRSKNIKEVSDKELQKIHQEYKEISQKTLMYFAASSTSSTCKVEEQIKEIL
ncbi:MAG: hypothetical protein AABX98_02605, partial [Nanoarchaeota archaeon]